MHDDTATERHDGQPAVGVPVERSVMPPAGVYMHREQRRHGKDAPGPRMRRVMARLSRDKWLPPSRVVELAERLCWKYGSGNPSWTAKAWLPEMAPYVGMLRGQEVCDRFHPKRAVLIRRLQKIEDRTDLLALGELEVLNFVLKKGAYQWTRTN